MKTQVAGHQTKHGLKSPSTRPTASWLLAGILALLLITTIGTASAAGTVPDVPTDLTAVADTNADPQAAIALSWTASASDGGSEITGHEYRWRARSGNWWTDWTTIPDSKPADANATSYTVTGLLHPNPPQVYTFEVRARNANGSSAASNQVSETFDVPAQITQLKAATGNQTVTLEWDTPENNGRKITHYQYAVLATRPGESTHTVVWPQKLPGSDGDTTSATISGLTNGLPHIISIGAVNAIGVASPNWKTGLVPAATPGEPTNLSAEPGDQTATLSWTAPESDGGSAVNGYSFQRKEGTADFADWTAITDSDINTRDHTVTGLTNGVVYSFRVRAENEQGEGSGSNEASTTPMSVPSAPHNMTSTPGNGQVALTWATPASNGGSAITGYEYRYQPASGVFIFWTAVPDSNVNTAAYTVAGLTNGTGHEFQVRAITATNKGAAASANATPIANPPTPPQTLSALHFNQSVKLSWLAPVSNGGSPIIRYEYRQRAGEAAFGEWTSIPDSGTGQANELTYSVPRLTNGTNYTFEVSSVNNAAASASSSQASATPQVITTPGQPRDYAVSSGDGEIFLQWLKPAQDGGRPISNYEYCLELINQCSANWTTIPDNAISLGERGFLAVASSNGTYTRAKLHAVNSQGGGAEDDLAAVPIAGAPAPPAELKAETISSTQVKITWTEPQSRAGTTITSYTLEQSADGLKWKDGSQPKGSTSIIKDIGKDAIAYFRIRTRFKTDSPLIISGADFSRANSPWTEIVTASTVGAEQNTAVTVSVADSYAHEGTSSDVVFDVYLSSRPETASTISVDYRTHDHTATAGQDYTAQSGTLAFSPSERAKTISVPVIDDNHEDSGESFTLVLSNPTGAIIARAAATGSIYNEESLITGFTLIDLSTNSDVQTIAEGDAITFDNPAEGNYTIRANPAAEATIGSVHLELSGARTTSRTDNDLPYTLYATGGQGLPPGDYTLKATVYQKPDAVGVAHQTLSMSFTVADSAEVTVPFTALFSGMPPNHDGETAFTFRVQFSEDAGIGYANMRDHAFTISDGDVTSARRVDRRSDLWEITVEPDSAANVAISLPGNRTCGTTGAVCTRGPNARELTNSPSTTVPGPEEETATNTPAAGKPTITGTAKVDQILTAGTSGITDADGLTNASYTHSWAAAGNTINGQTAATYQIQSRDAGKAITVTVTFIDDADNAESVTSAPTDAILPTVPGAPTHLTVTQNDPGELYATWRAPSDDGGNRVSGYRVFWKAATGDWKSADDTSDTTATSTSHTITGLTNGTLYHVRVAAINSAGHSDVSAQAEGTPSAPTPLTVQNENVPTTHNGDEFTFDLRFSEHFPLSYVTLRDHAFTLTGGTIKQARRLDAPSNVRWRITVKPAGASVVRIQLPTTADCNATGAVCTSDGRKLSTSLDFTVPKAP